MKYMGEGKAPNFIYAYSILQIVTGMAFIVTVKHSCFLRNKFAYVHNKEQWNEK